MLDHAVSLLISAILCEVLHTLRGIEKLIRLCVSSHLFLAFQHPAVQPSERATGDAGGGQHLAESPGQPEAPRAGITAGAVPGAGAAAPGAL